jgi:hypothetical protein
MDELKNNPGKKMRTLLAGGKLSSPLARLPKKVSAVSFLPVKPEKKAEVSTESKEAPSSKDISLKNETKKETKKEAPRVSRAPKPVLPASMGLKLDFWPPFWTIASVLSLTINLVLIIILILVWLSAPSLNVGGLLQMGNNLLGGLYTNFEKMDRAHIIKTIPVDATVPVKFDLQLNQQTSVVLSQAVTIDNALVTVKTGGLNITNALTTIVLPQGTTLPIVLNLTVPVDTTIPVKLNVEVDIPLKETQLHDPFKGLGEVVQPFYCMVNPVALNLDGQSICAKK